MIKAIFFLFTSIAHLAYSMNENILAGSSCQDDFECFIDQGNFDQAVQAFQSNSELQFNLDDSMNDFVVMNRAVRVMRFLHPWMKRSSKESLQFLQYMFDNGLADTLKAVLEANQLEHSPWIYLLDQPYFKGQEEIVKLFVQQGFSVNQQLAIDFNDNQAYVTPLFLVFKHQNNIIKNLLFALKANVAAVQIIPKKIIKYEKEYTKASGEWKEVLFPVLEYKEISITLKNYLILSYMIAHELVDTNMSKADFTAKYDQLKNDSRRPYFMIPGDWSNQKNDINEILDIALRYKDVLHSKKS